MKTFKKLFFLTFCFFLCLACSNLIKVPLEADFVGAYTYGKFGETNPNPKCPMNVVVDGVGSGSYIGNSTVHFDFV